MIRKDSVPQQLEYRYWIECAQGRVDSHLYQEFLSPTIVYLRVLEHTLNVSAHQDFHSDMTTDVKFTHFVSFLRQ